MAKNSRDELRQELNSQIAVAKTELANIKTEIDTLHTEREELKTSFVKMKDDLQTRFSQDTDNFIESIKQKLTNSESQLKELESLKTDFIAEKNACLEQIEQDTQQAIQKQETLLEDKFREKHDQEKDSWFKKLQEWSNNQNNLFTEKLKNFVETETGRAANIVSQDVLSAESRNLASEKDVLIKSAENKLTWALAIMIITGIIMYHISDNVGLWNILYKVLMFVPFGFYIWLQVKKINRETCLRDHYHHKQLVMASYSAFFGFLKNNEKFTDEKQVQMTEQMFNEVRDNAANKADNQDVERLKAQNKLLCQIIKKIPDLDNLNKNIDQIKDLLQNSCKNDSDTNN